MMSMKYEDVIVQMPDSIVYQGHFVGIEKAVTLAKELQRVTDADIAVVDCVNNTITVRHTSDDKLKYVSDRITVCLDENGEECMRTVIASIRRYKEFVERRDSPC